MAGQGDSPFSELMGFAPCQEHHEVIHCCVGDKHNYLDFTCGDLDSF